MGERGRRPERHAPQKKLDDEELRAFRYAFRHAAHRREVDRASLLSSRPRTARRCSTCRRAARRWAVTCRRARRCGRSRGAGAERRSAVRSGAERARAVHHHGVRADSGATAEGYGDGQTHRAHRRRRGAHVRHADAVSPGRHLFRHGPALRTRGSDELLYYREAKDGQILEEGINEAGAMSSWIAAATATARTARRFCRSIFSTRCSASSASAT